jgi:hypothetical protein
VPTASIHTGATTRAKPLPVCWIVTSAEGAPRLSTLAHTLPIGSGRTSRRGSTTNGSASAHSPSPANAPGPQLPIGSIALPSSLVAIASG